MISTLDRGDIWRSLTHANVYFYLHEEKLTKVKGRIKGKRETLTRHDFVWVKIYHELLLFLFICYLFVKGT